MPAEWCEWCRWLCVGLGIGALVLLFVCNALGRQRDAAREDARNWRRMYLDVTEDDDAAE
jgi:hypothetical protein